MKSRLFALLLLLLPAVALAAPDAPQAGVDYVEIPDGKPFAPLAGKVEVVEVFGYTCVHCAHLEPTLAQWKRRQPAHVRFTAVPAAFGGYWLPYARAYYAAESLGVLERTHAQVFKALHEQQLLPIQNASADEIADYYASLGVDRQRFIDALRNPALEARLQRSREFMAAAGVEGTPTLIVNGRYRVIGGRNFDEALRIVDHLVARERAAARR